GPRRRPEKRAGDPIRRPPLPLRHQPGQARRADRPELRLRLTGGAVGRPGAIESSPAGPPDRGAVGRSVVALAAAFTAYFCMYGFRKPFTAADYEGDFLGGVGYKTVLVTAQVLGYTASKFIGIKVIAEMRPERRAAWLLGLIGLAELALVLFAVVPPPYNFPPLF